VFFTNGCPAAGGTSAHQVLPAGLVNLVAALVTLKTRVDVDCSKQPEKSTKEHVFIELISSVNHAGIFSNQQHSRKKVKMVRITNSQDAAIAVYTMARAISTRIFHISFDL